MTEIWTDKSVEFIWKLRCGKQSIVWVSAENSDLTPWLY